MRNSFFALIARLRNIGRWGLMRNTYSENVQEHSHMVAVLAHCLGVIRRDVFGGEIDPNFIAAAALFHDASEIFTGDLPSPIKYFDGEITSSYKRIESLAANKLLQMLPEQIRPAYAPLLQEESGEIRELIKAADKLSAYIKCVEEIKAGNTEFSGAKEQIEKNLSSSKLPEVEYFLEMFMPSFSMSLDDLSLSDD